LFNSVFEENIVTIPSSADIVFVADLFAEDYLGGAELTTKALIDSYPEGINIYKVNSSKVTMKTLESGYNKYWVFGNFSAIDLNLIPSIVRNIKYSILEYDYKLCKYRSFEKHTNITGTTCNCHEEDHGKLISAFFHGAIRNIYMSTGQMERYHSIYPFLKDEGGSAQTVLNSVFSSEFFINIRALRKEHENTERTGWLVLKSKSWIKGTDEAIKWCEDNNLNYTLIENMQHKEVLELMAKSKGFVYLPKGGDTCPRMVLEAQLLGCELHLNKHVQHHDEFPFTGGSIEDIEIYLHGRRDAFWNQLIEDMNWIPKISGYTTVYNCVSQGYPFVQSIQSMLGFCDEVIVLDGGSSDSTFDILLAMSEKDKRLKVHKYDVDWINPRSAVEDGGQKARARAQCNMPFCWQMDSDEIVHEDDYKKIIKLCRQFPKFIDLISLPVVEYWGGLEKVRMDINPWKWRLSRNRPYITHGIPKDLRKIDEEGNLYASLGTDGCDYIHSETFEPLPHASFYTQDVHNIRISAIQGNVDSQKKYETWFNNVIEIMPSVFHYSWFNIERKIKTYKGFWQRHWQSLFDIKQEDTIENNMFFDKPWSEVNDEDIEELALKLGKEMGGWIFHSKIDFKNPTPHLNINKNQPEVMDGKTKNIGYNLQLQS